MTITQSSDVTEKRASTEEDSASNVAKKPRVEDVGDKSMEDDSDSESGWKVDAEYYYGPKGPAKRGSVLGVVEPEPEWGVDSYDDDEYVSDPESRAHFATDEEYNEYRDRMIQRSKDKGFSPDPIKCIWPIPDLEERWHNKTTREYLADLASLCVNRFNEEKGKNVEIVSIVRANRQVGGTCKMYITFMAREYPNGPLVEYQAKAMDLCGGGRPIPILCRPAPN